MEVYDTRDKLTPFAFVELFFKRYQRACLYRSRRDDMRAVFVVQEHVFNGEEERVVRADPHWECSCYVSVALGVPCEHILCVLIGLHGRYCHDDALFNSRWFKHQPEPRLRHRSPLLGAVGGRVGSGHVEDPVQAVRSDAAIPIHEIASQMLAETSTPTQVYVQEREEGAGRSSHQADMQNDVRHYVSNVVARAGFDTNMLSRLESTVKDFANEYLDASTEGAVSGESLALQKGKKRSGQPKVLRANGLKNTRRQRCTACRSEGHTMQRCPVVLERRKRDQVRDSDLLFWGLLRFCPVLTSYVCACVCSLWQIIRHEKSKNSVFLDIPSEPQQ
eukprot:GHVU01134121.1.p1 GENE.GHVU01134121.1~~GHVU01134121.1.p1  ORF type:complete len:333 (+),score=19.82 GHVU01134121.1:1033-2031(+)